MEETEYILHINFGEIKSEVDRLSKRVDKDMMDKISFFIGQLKATTDRIEPTLRKETNNERELWQEYRKLQNDKLAILDLRHEWDYIGDTVKNIDPRLDFLVKDAIEELSDHVSVLAESHRAHIDILEIYNTRKIEVLALVITAVISYLAVWEFFVRDLLVSLVFPNGLSPLLNYVLVVATLAPVYVTAAWAWLKRKSYF